MRFSPVVPEPAGNLLKAGSGIVGKPPRFIVAQTPAPVIGGVRRPRFRTAHQGHSWERPTCSFCASHVVRDAGVGPLAHGPGRPLRIFIRRGSRDWLTGPSYPHASLTVKHNMGE